jgi:hypothetical protein
MHTRRVLPAGALTHLMITIPFWTSELFLGPAWLGANAVPLAVAALFVLTSGAYLELLVATRAKVGGISLLLISIDTAALGGFSCFLRQVVWG